MIAGPPHGGQGLRDAEVQRPRNRTTESRRSPHTPAAGEPGLRCAERQPLPTLDLSRVYVLTSAGTCSASEAIINGLRGVGVQVIQIGGTTCGKPYGFYPPDNCGTTYFASSSAASTPRASATTRTASCRAPAARRRVMCPSCTVAYRKLRPPTRRHAGRHAGRRVEPRGDRPVPRRHGRLSERSRAEQRGGRRRGGTAPSPPPGPQQPPVRPALSLPGRARPLPSRPAMAMCLRLNAASIAVPSGDRLDRRSVEGRPGASY